MQFSFVYKNEHVQYGLSDSHTHRHTNRRMHTQSLSVHISQDHADHLHWADSDHSERVQKHAGQGEKTLTVFIPRSDSLRLLWQLPCLVSSIPSIPEEVAAGNWWLFMWNKEAMSPSTGPEGVHSGSYRSYQEILFTQRNYFSYQLFSLL